MSRIVHDLGRMAHEVAPLYRIICKLEGDDALADPYNHAVLEKQLAKNAALWQDIWHRPRPSRRVTPNQ